MGCCSSQDDNGKKNNRNRKNMRPTNASLGGHGDMDDDNVSTASSTGTASHVAPRTWRWERHGETLARSNSNVTDDDENNNNNNQQQMKNNSRRQRAVTIQSPTHRPSLNPNHNNNSNGFDDGNNINNNNHNNNNYNIEEHPTIIDPQSNSSKYPTGATSNIVHLPGGLLDGEYFAITVSPALAAAITNACKLIDDAEDIVNCSSSNVIPNNNNNNNNNSNVLNHQQHGLLDFAIGNDAQKKTKSLNNNSNNNTTTPVMANGENNNIADFSNEPKLPLPWPWIDDFDNFDDDRNDKDCSNNNVTTISAPKSSSAPTSRANITPAVKNNVAACYNIHLGGSSGRKTNTASIGWSAYDLCISADVEYVMKERASYHHYAQQQTSSSQQQAKNPIPARCVSGVGISVRKSSQNNNGSSNGSSGNNDLLLPQQLSVFTSNFLNNNNSNNNNSNNNANPTMIASMLNGPTTASVGSLFSIPPVKSAISNTLSSPSSTSTGGSLGPGLVEQMIKVKIVESYPLDHPIHQNSNKDCSNHDAAASTTNSKKRKRLSSIGLSQQGPTKLATSHVAAKIVLLVNQGRLCITTDDAERADEEFDQRKKDFFGDSSKSPGIKNASGGKLFSFENEHEIVESEDSEDDDDDVDEEEYEEVEEEVEVEDDNRDDGDRGNKLTSSVIDEVELLKKKNSGGLSNPLTPSSPSQPKPKKVIKILKKKKLATSKKNTVRERQVSIVADVTDEGKENQQAEASSTAVDSLGVRRKSFNNSSVEGKYVGLESAHISDRASAQWYLHLSGLSQPYTEVHDADTTVLFESVAHPGFFLTADVPNVDLRRFALPSMSTPAQWNLSLTIRSRKIPREIIQKQLLGSASSGEVLRERIAKTEMNELEKYLEEITTTTATSSASAAALAPTASSSILSIQQQQNKTIPVPLPPCPLTVRDMTQSFRLVHPVIKTSTGNIDLPLGREGSSGVGPWQLPWFGANAVKLGVFDVTTLMSQSNPQQQQQQQQQSVPSTSIGNHNNNNKSSQSVVTSGLFTSSSANNILGSNKNNNRKRNNCYYVEHEQESSAQIINSPKSSFQRDRNVTLARPRKGMFSISSSVATTKNSSFYVVPDALHHVKIVSAQNPKLMLAATGSFARLIIKNNNNNNFQKKPTPSSGFATIGNPLSAPPSPNSPSSRNTNNNNSTELSKKFLEVALCAKSSLKQVFHIPVGDETMDFDDNGDCDDDDEIADEDDDGDDDEQDQEYAGTDDTCSASSQLAEDAALWRVAYVESACPVRAHVAAAQRQVEKFNSAPPSATTAANKNTEAKTDDTTKNETNKPPLKLERRSSLVTFANSPHAFRYLQQSKHILLVNKLFPGYCLTYSKKTDQWVLAVFGGDTKKKYFHNHDEEEEVENDDNGEFLLQGMLFEPASNFSPQTIAENSSETMQVPENVLLSHRLLSTVPTQLLTRSRSHERQFIVDKWFKTLFNYSMPNSSHFFDPSYASVLLQRQTSDNTNSKHDDDADDSSSGLVLNLPNLLNFVKSKFSVNTNTSSNNNNNTSPKKSAASRLRQQQRHQQILLSNLSVASASAIRIPENASSLGIVPLMSRIGSSGCLVRIVVNYGKDDGKPNQDANNDNNNNKNSQNQMMMMNNLSDAGRRCCSPSTTTVAVGSTIPAPNSEQQQNTQLPETQSNNNNNNSNLVTPILEGNQQANNNNVAINTLRPAVLSRQNTNNHSSRPQSSLSIVSEISHGNTNNQQQEQRPGSQLTSFSLTNNATTSTNNMLNRVTGLVNSQAGWVMQWQNDNLDDNNNNISTNTLNEHLNNSFLLVPVLNYSNVNFLDSAKNDDWLSKNNNTMLSPASNNYLASANNENANRLYFMMMHLSSCTSTTVRRPMFLTSVPSPNSVFAALTNGKNNALSDEMDRNTNFGSGGLTLAPLSSNSFFDGSDQIFSINLGK